MFLNLQTKLYSQKTLCSVCICAHTQSEAAQHSHQHRTLDAVQQALVFYQQVSTHQLGGTAHL